LNFYNFLLEHKKKQSQNHSTFETTSYSHHSERSLNNKPRLTILQYFNDLTITQVSQLAQCNRVTFYAHYRDLNELLAAIVDDYLQELINYFHKSYQKLKRFSSNLWHPRFFNLLDSKRLQGKDSSKIMARKLDFLQSKMFKGVRVRNKEQL